MPRRFPLRAADQSRNAWHILLLTSSSPFVDNKTQWPRTRVEPALPALLRCRLAALSGWRGHDLVSRRERDAEPIHQRVPLVRIYGQSAVNSAPFQAVLSDQRGYLRLAQSA